MADALTDLDEADGLLRNVAGHLRSGDRAHDAGSLLKIGRLHARLQAGRALARTGRPDEAGAFAVDLLLEIGRAFPASGWRAPRAGDEDAHLRFEAIGRCVLSQGVPL